MNYQNSALFRWIHPFVNFLYVHHLGINSNKMYSWFAPHGDVSEKQIGLKLMCLFVWNYINDLSQGELV